MREELSAIFVSAREGDIKNGGQHTISACMIHVWSSNGRAHAMRENSEIIGSFNVDWLDYAIRQIERDESHQLNDLL